MILQVIELGMKSFAVSGGPLTFTQTPAIDRLLSQSASVHIYLFLMNKLYHLQICNAQAHCIEDHCNLSYTWAGVQC